MSTTAIILAGGVGSRFGENMPKQFYKVNSIPVIVYTIRNFQKSKLIDNVLIVCVKEWIDECKKIVKEYKLSKVKWIIEGGKTGHESSSNAIFYLKDKLKNSDYIIFHDSARPILPSRVIEDMVKIAKSKGNACASLPMYETVLYTENQTYGTKDINRKLLRKVQTPQMYKYSIALDIYNNARLDKKNDFVYADTLAVYYKQKVYFSTGFVNNIKITNKEDIHFFKYLLNLKDDQIL